MLKASASVQSQTLCPSADWSFADLDRAYDAIEEVALEDLGLNLYHNQIEVISSEQMLDSYSSVGLPFMYKHWSFGKRFIQDEMSYRKGHTGLAYEIVINSDPCISYNMEENTMQRQILVMSHAACGHNHFFKNNYLFKQWTDASSILNYLSFAKSFVARCEEKHGVGAVERVLDAAHSLMDQSVFRYHHPSKKNGSKIEEYQKSHKSDQTLLEIWTDSTFRGEVDPHTENNDRTKRRVSMDLPEENLLYFLEKFSPSLKSWERELLRIVRVLAQYLYPQKQTKVMNEGCACFVHYYIINALYDKGLLTEGDLMEMLQDHTNVIYQPSFDHPHFSGINPYALGFHMMQDIKRICTHPTDEDREWFPGFAGDPDWRSVLKHAWRDYRDESFILQFLSPHLIRYFKLFSITDDEKSDALVVSHIHEERSYKEVRKQLSDTYNLSHREPDIQIVDAHLAGDRVLKLKHTVYDGVMLEETSQVAVLKAIKVLWGYDVELEGRDYQTNHCFYQSSTSKRA